jgi:GNAT superfamily N-acetyltransferase
LKGETIVQFNYVKTTSENPGFIALIKLLDADLAEKDGEEHSFYAQYNKLDTIKNVVIAVQDDKVISCGAFKDFSNGVVEIKRMFTLPEYRGKGIAAQVLAELEKWAAESGYKKCILETGKKQTAAIALYAKCGYTLIPNYGQYEGKENSVCFEKQLK